MRRSSSAFISASRRATVIAMTMAVALTAARAAPPPGVEITPGEITAIIRQYTSPEAAAQMSEWGKLLFRPDAAYRQAVREGLPAAYRRSERHDERLSESLNAIISRALAPYGKEYGVIVLDHPGPQMMHESYSLLVVTVGLLARMPSDDALVMFIYHEMAHELFAAESAALKHRLAELSRTGEADGEEARRIAKQLVMVELKCDAAATKFALANGYHPAPFSQVIAEIYREFPAETSGVGPSGFNLHPAPHVRRQVIEGIGGREAAARRPRVSAELVIIKSLLAAGGRGQPQRNIPPAVDGGPALSPLQQPTDASGDEWQVF